MSSKHQTLTRAVLEHLADLGVGMVDVFFPKWNPGSTPMRKLVGLDPSRYASPQAAKHSVSSILYRLKQQGFVKSSGPKKKTRWAITLKGRNYLKEQSRQAKFQQRMRVALPADGITRLVTFDVPEKQRKKRNWLRAELIACGYSSLHQSVFIGQCPFPEDSIKAMDRLGVSKYVHIVSIDKKGTLIRGK